MKEGNILNQTGTRIAYFSMEIGLNSDVPTYSGGLGVLAGDTLKACSDLRIPIVGMTMLYRQGYFYQKLDPKGQQSAEPYEWQPKRFLNLLPEKVSVDISGRSVFVQAWTYRVVGRDGFEVPVVFLDTEIPENDPEARFFCRTLYGGEDRYRLSQELILGVGGVRMLEKLGFNDLRRYHLNEGHSAFLTLELLKKNLVLDGPGAIEAVRQKCVFTTHTPVPAGHDKFDYSLVREVLGDYFPLEELKKLGGGERLNMTLLALNLSDYVNGVAKSHGEVSREMFPGYSIDAITNGVHTGTWACESFNRLFSEMIPGGMNDPFSLRYILSVPRERIQRAHQAAKKELIELVNRTTLAQMSEEVLTIGFARRATAYKRFTLIFSDLDRLISISRNIGRLQLVFSGKAHPEDREGQAMIKAVIETAKRIHPDIPVAYLENYDMELARIMVSGCDLWLNTPRKPKEASGSSGMKAALNGVPSLSILDGWWIEGCLEGITGWAIGSAQVENNEDAVDAASLYEKLERVIVPLYYSNQEGWVDVMRNSIALNGSFFNTHRMMQQYVLNAYMF